MKCSPGESTNLCGGERPSHLDSSGPRGGYSSKLATRQDPEESPSSVAWPSHSLNGDPTPYTAQRAVPENLAEHMPRGMSPLGGNSWGHVPTYRVPNRSRTKAARACSIVIRDWERGPEASRLSSEEARDCRGGDRQRRGQGPRPHPQVRHATVPQRSDGSLALWYSRACSPVTDWITSFGSPRPSSP